MRHGQFTTYTVNTGLQSNAIFSSMEAADHTMWFASPSGLICFDGDHWTTYGASHHDPPLNVRTVFEDPDRMLWVGTSHGLARFDGGQIEVPRGLPQALGEEVLSIGQDAQGFLWVVTDQHVLQVDRAKLLSGTLKDNDVLSYGADDGLIEAEGVRRDRSLVSDSSGRIWLSLPHSLAVADVKAAEGYRLPVGVRIDAVLPEGTFAAKPQGFELPRETRNITFRYSGTNISIPQRTQFRYLLDGVDQTWSSDASLRQVAYTPLSPGAIHFASWHRMRWAFGMGQRQTLRSRSSLHSGKPGIFAGCACP